MISQTYKGTISYDFTTLESSSVQKSFHETIIVDNEAIQKKQKEIIKGLTTYLNPFSCINPIYNFVIIDKKKIKLKNDCFYFANKNSQKQQYHDSQQGKNQPIDCLSHFLEENWSQCVSNLNNLLKRYKNSDNLNQDQMNRLSLQQKKILSNKFQTANQISVFMIGQYPTQPNTSNCYFAFQLQDKNIKESLLNFPVKLGNNYFISKYIIFSKTQPLSLLNLIITFFDKEIHNRDNQQQYIVLKSQEVYKKNKIHCRLTIEDKHNYFKSAILNHNNFQKDHLLSRFRFQTSKNFIDYPYKEPIMRRRKYIPKSSYSLAFQGGGAKGAAYVGAYKAIRQMKKDGQTIPITSIMGSSAGGIIALAISTNIEPYQVQKICYKMNTIPQIDRIDRRDIKKSHNAAKDLDQVVQKQKKILSVVKDILHEYGIINYEVIETLINFFQKHVDSNKLKNFEICVIEWILAAVPSIGQIFDFKQQKNREFNMAGLLIQGALMKGQAIHDIGADCLVKYLLSNQKIFSHAENLTNIFSLAFVSQINQLVGEFPITCGNVLNIPFSTLVDRKLNRVIIAIVNKIMTIIARIHPKQFSINTKFVQSLGTWFTFQDQLSKKKIQLTKTSLIKLIQNHKRIYTTQDHIGAQKLKREKKIKDIEEEINKNHGISYIMLSQILDQAYLLNPTLLILKGHPIQGSTVRTFLQSIFPQYFTAVYDDSKFLQEIAENIIDTFKEENICNNPNFHFKQIQNYLKHQGQLKQAVKKITLRQYYKLTNIELTCTSVDLDDKILRFFNHKTTPDLPVCRAIQMTGSFPVVFKAQKWKQQWGKYLVHYANVRRQIDIKDHQFTDGGMLANFPIRYFDNEAIRDTYFSHVTCKNEGKNKTILLGFGLDQLNLGSYMPSQNQITQLIHQNTTFQQANYKLIIAFSQLMSFSHPKPNPSFWEKLKQGWNKIQLKFETVGLIKQIMDSIKKVHKNVISWKSINHSLLQQIPVVKFLMKFIDSYPHADRNLNLECFKNTILITNLQPIQQTFQEKMRVEKLDVQLQIKRLNHESIAPVYNGSQIDIQKEISDQIDKVPININILDKAVIIFKSIRQRCLSLQKNMKQDQKLEKQQIIKQKLLNIIYYKMKLKFTQKQIQTETLKFMGIKYKIKIINQTNKQLIQQISKKKLIAQWNYSLYSKIQSQFPIKILQKIKNDQFKVDKIQKSLIEQINTYANLDKNQQGLKELISLSNFYLTNNIKYLVQYIFLEKIRSKNNPLMLEQAIDLVNRTSHHDLLLNYDIKKKRSYISISDLKYFYNNIFNGGKMDNIQANIDPITLLSQQQLVKSERDNFQDLDKDFFKIIKNDKFYESDSIDKDISPKTMQNEGYNYLKINLHQIQFASIVGEAFFNPQIPKKIKKKLSQLTRKEAKNFAKKLSDILHLQTKISANDLENLMKEKATNQKIIHILYLTEREDYSQSLYIQKIFYKKYEKNCQLKESHLKVIQNQKNNKKLQGSLSMDTNPLQLKINYLIDIELNLVYLLLKKSLKDDRALRFNLQSAKITGNHKEQYEKIKKEIQEQHNERRDDDERMINKITQYQRDIQLLMIYLIQIQHDLYEFTKERDQNLSIIKNLKEDTMQINVNMGKIKDVLNNKLNQLINLPSREITIQNINDAYTLDYIAFRKICSGLFKSINYVYDIIYNGLKNKQQNTIGNYIQKDITFLKQNIISSFKYLNQHNFSLPNFKVYWNFYQKEFRSKQYSRKMKESLTYQLSNSFIQKWNKNKKQIKVHLILQGQDIANVYYPYYYEIISQFQNKSIEQKNDLSLNNVQRCLNWMEIRAITTSSYHSIFGFLLALQCSNEEIKKQMVDIRQIALTFENAKIVQNNFKNYHWIKTSSQDYKQFWNYILQEQIIFFRQLQKLANKRAQSHNLQNQFSKIKDMYINQEQNIHHRCKSMIDEMASSLSKIDNEADAKNKTLQIARTYGINYICSLRGQHQYQTMNKREFKIFQTIIKKLFHNYGSFFEGLVTNVLTAEGRIHLRKKDSTQIYKGIFMKQLLTVFKIKAYVIDKLKKNQIKENITLLQFFDQAPKKILLNFTTIHIDNARLQFMNKNTMPNIPIWAAIVASASQPFFYRQFQSSKDWQNPVFDKASLFQRIVNDFFGSKASDNNLVRYASGNMISSLPMELLTNETIISQMFTFKKREQKQISTGSHSDQVKEQIEQPYFYLGFAFNTNTKNYSNPTIPVERNYLLDFSIFDSVKEYFQLPQDHQNPSICQSKQHNHHTTAQYSQKSGLGSKVFSLFGSATSVKMLNIFIASNDNFILHSYSNKLVRLPIKINTLQFHYIVDKQMKSDYGVSLPNQRIKQTIDRSQQITKYFAKEHFISRIQPKKGQTTQTSRNKKFNQQKFTINVRVKIFVQESQMIGTKIYYAKVDLLSHSKWNKNKFNNFLVDYSFDERNFSKTAERAEQSEVIWKLNQSKRIFLKFYFPHYDLEKSLVNYTRIAMDISEIINQLPLTDSYDYSFSIYDFMKDEVKERFLDPFRKNQSGILEKDLPKLKLSKWESKQSEKERNFYIRPLEITK